MVVVVALSSEVPFAVCGVGGEADEASVLHGQEPSRVFVLDEHGSLRALVSLVHQQQPLLRLPGADRRVGELSMGNEACQ